MTFALISFKVPGEDYLDELAAGANAAAKQINASGGFGGRHVNIIECNSMLAAASAADCAHRTLLDHPIAMFGCELTWFASGLPVYAAAHVPSVNCLNNNVDNTNPWSFGVVGGAYGQTGAQVQYLCTLANVKKVVALFPVEADYSSQIYPDQVVAPLKACGKSAGVVYYPLTAVDMAPYAAKMLQQKPDFILASVPVSEAVQILKDLAQDGFPASKTIFPDTSFTYQAVQAAGKAADGAYIAAQFTPWGVTGNAEVNKYLAAFKGSSTDPRDPSVEWGYAYMEMLYTAAKYIGFDKFNSATLAHFLSTANGVHFPLSRSIDNPGPAKFPQVKQPYEQIAQWTGSVFKIVPTGPKKDGWTYDY